MLDAFYQFPLILVCCSPKFWEGWNRPLFPILKAKPAIQAQSKGQDSIKKNFAYNVTYQLLLIVLPVITTPYIARIFGADGIGTYAYTYTVANFFVLFTMLGVKNYGNRSVAAVRNDKTRLGRVFWEIYGL
ncbi:MAG: oligosaccharide flippase family protein, partial [Clostridiales bacterium]|nr:oligosaccharide flippase family protein [Clostridiales bacterium]